MFRLRRRRRDKSRRAGRRWRRSGRSSSACSRSVSTWFNKKKRNKHTKKNSFGFQRQPTKLSAQYMILIVFVLSFSSKGLYFRGPHLLAAPQTQHGQVVVAFQQVVDGARRHLVAVVQRHVRQLAHRIRLRFHFLFQRKCVVWYSFKGLPRVSQLGGSRPPSGVTTPIWGHDPPFGVTTPHLGSRPPFGVTTPHLGSRPPSGVTTPIRGHDPPFGVTTHRNISYARWR